MIYIYKLKLICCNKCNCIQLKYLIEPEILYSKHYTNSTFSPIWNKHNIIFSNFVIENTDENKFLEIGANKGELYKLLSERRNIDYSVLDMYKHDDLPKNITFMKGNCENFNYDGYDTIILSHVFEHLYKPKEFIENIKKCKVKNIFISIPNFNSLLDKKTIIMIHSQHTFYCGYEYIIYLFSLYHYRCEKMFMCDEIPFKSSMFKFVLDETIVHKQIPTTDIVLYKNIYVDNIALLNNIEIPPNTYIAPSGIYGQYLYYFINNKKNIVGFIDNNKERHNKKLYGTDKLVYSPLNIDLKSNIILCDCPYKDEIYSELIKLKLNIMYVN
jgi:hypothetical protein